ncbi:hypothetical protein BLOT_009249 [Blomia tropicalis]|nr:hypothetical protein BLOT_009249 [Blomia tropicalis]
MGVPFNCVVDSISVFSSNLMPVKVLVSIRNGNGYEDGGWPIVNSKQNEEQIEIQLMIVGHRVGEMNNLFIKDV